MYLSCSTLVCVQKDYPRFGDALAEIAKLGFRAVDVAALDKRGYGGAVAIEYFSGFDEGFRSTLALRDLLRRLELEG